jgi:hypothetical protein
MHVELMINELVWRWFLGDESRLRIRRFQFALIEAMILTLPAR